MLGDDLVLATEVLVAALTIVFTVATVLTQEAVMTTSPPETASATRPSMVTAAAVLAFIWGGMTIISSLLSVAAGSLLGDDASACAQNDQSGLCAFASDSSSLLIALGIALVVTAGLVIWGGAVALMLSAAAKIWFHARGAVTF